MEIHSTGRDREFRFRPVLIGPPGVGKTVCAATLSEQASPSNGPWPRPCKLDDLLWIVTDGGDQHAGLDSLWALGMDVDYIDLSNEVGMNLINKTIEALGVAKKMVESGQKKGVVLDTASTLDRIIFTYHAERFEKWQKFDAQLGMWMKVYTALRAIPGSVCVIFHEKYLAAPDTSTAAGADQKKRMDAEGRKAGSADLEITGQARNMFVSGTSTVLPLFIQRGMKGDERYISVTTGEVLSKTRYPSLAPKEPPNLRLIYEKVRSEAARLRGQQTTGTNVPTKEIK